MVYPKPYWHSGEKAYKTALEHDGILKPSTETAEGY